MQWWLSYDADCQHGLLSFNYYRCNCNQNALSQKQQKKNTSVWATVVLNLNKIQMDKAMKKWTVAVSRDDILSKQQQKQQQQQ